MSHSGVTGSLWAVPVKGISLMLSTLWTWVTLPHQPIMVMTERSGVLSLTSDVWTITCWTATCSRRPLVPTVLPHLVRITVGVGSPLQHSPGVSAMSLSCRKHLHGSATWNFVSDGVMWVTRVQVLMLMVLPWLTLLPHGVPVTILVISPTLTWSGKVQRHGTLVLTFLSWTTVLSLLLTGITRILTTCWCRHPSPHTLSITTGWVCRLLGWTAVLSVIPVLSLPWIRWISLIRTGSGVQVLHSLSTAINWPVWIAMVRRLQVR